MREQTAFWSGEYAKWTYSRFVGAPKYMGRVRMPGVSHALKDVSPSRIKSIVLTVNGVSCSDWTEEKEHIIFSKPWPRGKYRVEIIITYNFLEPAIYT